MLTKTLRGAGFPNGCCPCGTIFSPLDGLPHDCPPALTGHQPKALELPVEVSRFEAEISHISCGTYGRPEPSIPASFVCRQSLARERKAPLPPAT